VFTNPPDDSAGRLIDSCGLKGFRMGTAQVSPKHANFIQADPDGSADDVHGLISRVRATVAARCGVDLQTEVRMVGFTDSDGGAR
jgi:UDP-N-acetylmuramate dehydrogenase